MNTGTGRGVGKCTKTTYEISETNAEDKGLELETRQALSRRLDRYIGANTSVYKYVNSVGHS